MKLARTKKNITNLTSIHGYIKIAHIYTGQQQ